VIADAVSETWKVVILAKGSFTEIRTDE